VGGDKYLKSLGLWFRDKKREGKKLSVGGDNNFKSLSEGFMDKKSEKNCQWVVTKT
jgi:hypothetical protein